MNTSTQIVDLASAPATTVDGGESRWFAIRTRSRHEKVAARELDLQGITVFLPLVGSMRQWSDRRTKVEVPLFPGYAFVQVSFLSPDRVRVLRTTGVVGFVGQNPAGAWIPHEQIESIRTVLARGVPVQEHPFLNVGQRVRVQSGSLSGVEGILVAVKGSRNLVLSVEPIQRSLCISLDHYEIEAVEPKSCADVDQAVAR